MPVRWKGRAWFHGGTPGFFLSHLTRKRKPHGPSVGHSYERKLVLWLTVRRDGSRLGPQRHQVPSSTRLEAHLTSKLPVIWNNKSPLKKQLESRFLLLSAKALSWTQLIFCIYSVQYIINLQTWIDRCSPCPQLSTMSNDGVKACVQEARAAVPEARLLRQFRWTERQTCLSTNWPGQLFLFLQLCKQTKCELRRRTAVV